MSRIKTAVFPVAGRGTRFLPATKASPKEMLPIVDKPLIQYAAEEALAAGAEKLVFITGSGQACDRGSLRHDHELEQELEAQGKRDLLDAARHRAVVCELHLHPPAGAAGARPRGAVLAPGGWRRAVLRAPRGRPHRRRRALPRQMARVFENARSERAWRRDRGCRPDRQVRHRRGRAHGRAAQSLVKRIVEKPKPADAPSNLAVVGRYLLTPAVYDKLETTGRGAGGEIQLTDGIAALMQDESVYAYAFEGRRYDCGSKLGYLEATVEYGLKHANLGDQFANYLARLVANRLRR
jgi:UTP--glucose-1-phosphate uridylyltransferase